MGLKCLLNRKIEVPVLDATAISVSLITRDFDTAGSIMFLLGIGELLEEWTHKKSVGDLARSMSLNVSKVWLKTPENQEILVEASEIQKDDHVVVHMGNVIPFDGEIISGEAMVNQSSLTGEPVPVARSCGNTVFAGTVVEEGEITVRVKAVGGNNRFDQIVTMIEESEKLKSDLEGKAEHYADRLVPWTLGATAITYLLTRNVAKAMSILMVDFCCALKLAMPISVLSAIREASLYNVTVKGGKFLEAVADAAARKNLKHEEMHTKVEYIVAHGIATSIDGKRAVIGSYHFVFEDEGCVVPPGKQQLFEELPLYYSHLYLAIEGRLTAVICIEDPLRPEASAVVNSLITVGSDDLYQIVTLKYISNALMKRIKKNYRQIVGFNSGLIALGVAGVLPPTTTALLHNSSTILISLNSMKNLIE